MTEELQLVVIVVAPAELLLVVIVDVDVVNAMVVVNKLKSTVASEHGGQIHLISPMKIITEGISTHT